jgi:hypothetical protein
MLPGRWLRHVKVVPLDEAVPDAGSGQLHVDLVPDAAFADPGPAPEKQRFAP